jgi:hypothetical protein
VQLLSKAKIKTNTEYQKYETKKPPGLYDLESNMPLYQEKVDLINKIERPPTMDPLILDQMIYNFTGKRVYAENKYENDSGGFEIFDELMTEDDEMRHFSSNHIVFRKNKK